MNRATFFQRLALFFTALSGPFALTTANTNQGEASNVKLKSRTIKRELKWDGHEPEIRITPWGQKVFYDHHTYADAQKARWMLEGKTYEQLEPLVAKLWKRMEEGELTLRKGPARLGEGLWLIDVDGQQNTFFAEREVGKSEPIQLEYR